jgi:hypothetical protein
LITEHANSFYGLIFIQGAKFQGRSFAIIADNGFNACQSDNRNAILT